MSEKVGVARSALATLQALAFLDQPSAVERDAAIQRFEYTFEACWKCAQRFLVEVEKLTAGSPRAVIRASRDARLLDDRQAVLALQMCDDRNLTVHTHNEALAVELFGRLGAHARLIEAWLKNLEQAIASSGTPGT